jgi:hypothetical protein
MWKLTLGYGSKIIFEIDIMKIIGNRMGTYERYETRGGGVIKLVNLHLLCHYFYFSSTFSK